RHLGCGIEPQGGAVILLGGGKLAGGELHLRQDDKSVEQIGLRPRRRLKHSDSIRMLSHLRQNPAKMDLYMRLVWTRDERLAQKLFGLSKRALIFADQS